MARSAPSVCPLTSRRFPAHGPHYVRKGRHTCMDTTAALAAGTSTTISRSDKCATSSGAGSHAPNSSTLAPPSVVPVLASAAGPSSRMTDEATKLRPGSIVTCLWRLKSLLIRQTRKVPSGARMAKALRSGMLARQRSDRAGTHRPYRG